MDENNIVSNQTNTGLLVEKQNLSNNNCQKLRISNKNVIPNDSDDDRKQLDSFI